MRKCGPISIKSYVLSLRKFPFLTNIPIPLLEGNVGDSIVVRKEDEL